MSYGSGVKSKRINMLPGGGGRAINSVQGGLGILNAQVHWESLRKAGSV